MTRPADELLHTSCGRRRQARYGLTNNQIAAHLFISARTAGHHVENAMAKLGAQNRASCTSLAISWGLVSGSVLADLASTHRALA